MALSHQEDREAEASKHRPPEPGSPKNPAADVFAGLFVPTISYRPVERFREEAAALLPKADASKLIKLCQSASAPRVSFETTEREAA